MSNGVMYCLPCDPLGGQCSYMLLCVCRTQKLHQSLLERLYHYYDSHSQLINTETPLNILLSINYRSKMEILRFISAVFYGGPEVLKSEANVPSVLSITPLLFYAVQGHEIQNDTSVSYYNMSEVAEIVERVEEIYQKWPHEWGPRAANEIGVVSPYYDQVIKIRGSQTLLYISHCP